MDYYVTIWGRIFNGGTLGKEEILWQGAAMKQRFDIADRFEVNPPVDGIITAVEISIRSDNTSKETFRWHSNDEILDAFNHGADKPSEKE